FNPQQYAQFVNKELPLVKAAGKIPMGWADGFATVAGTKPPVGSIAEAWEPKATDATAAVSKGMKIVMAPADRTYLDQSYPKDNSGLGLGWACRGCDLDQNYNWDPATLNAQVPSSSIYGVEGALWAETIPQLADAEYLLLPRLMAVSEIAWSPTAARTGVTSPAFVDFAGRLADQGPRLQAAGLNFYTTKQVPWGITGTGDGATVNDKNKVVGTLAKVSAPGVDPTALTASINWGDGTKAKVGTIAGTGPTPGRVNALYTLTGKHTYAVSSCGGAATCNHTVTITVTSSTGTTGTFEVTV
ncbi:MAG: family 20 glycosylhydrolase, partial [Nakamurella sp.]